MWKPISVTIILHSALSSNAFNPIPSSRLPRQQRTAVFYDAYIDDWSKLVSPPPDGGRRFGPNWTTDPITLGPQSAPGISGTLSWSIGNSTFVPPERRMDLPVGQWLAKRHSLGIAMSGGGLRAATCALGWLRALNKLGVLPKARYLSANSGSTWTTLPLFSRQILDKKEKQIDMDYDHWLGKYVEPHEIEKTTEELGVMGEVLARSNVRFFKRAFKGLNTDWSQSIKQNYFDPVMGDSPDDFWLDANNAYLWNKNTPEVSDILNNRNTLPFPIYVSSCSSDIRYNQIYPMEMTPLYVGIPVEPTLTDPRSKLGGGFIQGMCFNAASTCDKAPVPVDDKAHILKNLNLPDKVVKLFELTAASSNFGAAADALTKTNLARFVPLRFLRSLKFLGFIAPGVYKWWSPDIGGDSVELQLVDGGLLDNLGALALLRRKCSTIVICYAAGSNPSKVNPKNWGKEFSDIAALFGKYQLPIPKFLAKTLYAETINERSQVFESDHFDELMKEMAFLSNEGKSLVVRRTMEVLPNPQAGIFEGGPVDVVWCFNGDNAKWRGSLNNKVKRARLTRKFPFIETADTDFTKNDVNMLAHLCSYQLVEGLKSVNFDVDSVPMVP